MEREESWRKYIVNYDLIDTCRIYGLYVRLSNITINSIKKAGRGKPSPPFEFVYANVDNVILPKDYVYLAFPPQNYHLVYSTLNSLKASDFGILRIVGKHGDIILPVSDPDDEGSPGRFKAYLLSEVQEFFSFGGAYYIGNTIYVDFVGRECSVVKIDARYVYVEYSEGNRKIRIRLHKSTMAPKRKEDVFDHPSQIIYLPYIMLGDVSSEEDGVDDD